MDAIPITVTSLAFADGDRIPDEYTCQGADLSPPLRWSRPDGTMAFALLVEDPDAPRGTWVHWVAYDIGPSVTSVNRAVPPPGATQGQNDFGTTGYRGPCPPPGHGSHRYVFTVYALAQDLGLGPMASASDVHGAARGITIGRGELVGTYSR